MLKGTFIASGYAKLENTVFSVIEYYVDRNQKEYIHRKIHNVLFTENTNIRHTILTRPFTIFSNSSITTAMPW